MIEVVDVSLKYSDGTLALQNIDLQIDSGEIVYITGPSGSGKTSLLKLLIGIERPTTGTLNVLGYDMIRSNEESIRQLRMMIGPVFQEFRLIKGRTALENVMLGMRFLNMTYRQMKDNAFNALEKVGLEQKESSYVENLSWGQCQRVAIARAVARKPLLILADEPTGNLDKDNALNILDLLLSFKDKDTTVIITTHATHLINENIESKLIRVEGGNICCEALG